MEICGRYKSSIFRNESSGYTIFSFQLRDFVYGFDDILIICKGVLPFSLICLPLKLTGEIETNDFGKQFNVTSVEPFVNNKEEAVNFISSEFFKGISEKTAKKVVDCIGTNIFDFPSNPNAYSILTEIDGIGPSKAKMIIEVLNHAKIQKSVLEYIEKFGGTFRNAERIVSQYPVNSLQRLKKNPYKVGKSGDMSFLTCDMIAKDNGFIAEDLFRIEFMVQYVIAKNYENGNVFITLNDLYQYVSRLSQKSSAFIGHSVSLIQVAVACNGLPDVITEYIDGDIRFYNKKAYTDEFTIAKNIKRLINSSTSFDINLLRLIKTCEEELHIKYSEKQKQCFTFLKSTGLKIVTGGPGTGKSTVINGLTYAYQKMYPEKQIVMMAPTGRAAQRINEITGKEAGTIHRMLKICPFGDSVKASYNADYPADMIIVDEASMIDNELMSMLSDCIKSNCLVILVGDIDQLPSVGPGSVLRDIINSNIETVHLDVNYRQKGKSIIIENALTINSGNADIHLNDDFQYVDLKDSQEIADKVVSAFTSLYDVKNPYSVQILCPQLKGLSGTININNRIQKTVCKGKTVIAHMSCRFKVGDKVMATKNNYDYMYFNGDIGIVKKATDDSVTIQFLKDEIEIKRDLIEDFQLAYACTVHKSQGAEYDTVIICMANENRNMLNRNLIYTAVTRAKKRVFIFSQKGCLSVAVSKTTTNKRTSGLTNKIHSLLMPA